MTIKIEDNITPQIKKGKSLKVVGNLWEEAPLLPHDTFMVFVDSLKIFRKDRDSEYSFQRFYEEPEDCKGVFVTRFSSFTGAYQSPVPGYRGFNINEFIFSRALNHRYVMRDPLEKGRSFNLVKMVASEGTRDWMNKYGIEPFLVEGTFYLGNKALDLACGDEKYGEVIESIKIVKYKLIPLFPICCFLIFKLFLFMEYLLLYLTLFEIQLFGVLNLEYLNQYFLTAK